MNGVYLRKFSYEVLIEKCFKFYKLKSLKANHLIIILLLLSLKTNSQITYSANPDLITVQHVGGPLSNAALGAYPTVSSDQYLTRSAIGASGVPPLDKVWATAAETGCVYGLAYSPLTEKAYASAYVKRHAQLGAGNGGNPAGHGSAGAIYELIDPDNGGGVSVLLDIGVDAGTTSRTPASDYFADPALKEVGRVGWGDIDVSLDGSILWAVNLFNKSLYKIQLSDGTILGIYPIPGVTGGSAFDSPYTDFENLEFKPFGLAVTTTSVYVGVVVSGETAGTFVFPCATGDPALGAHIFEFNATTSSFSVTPQLSFDFDGQTWDTGNCNSWGEMFKYVHWLEASDNGPPTSNFNDYKFAKPLIADLKIFNNELYIGIRNVTKDQASTIVGWFFPDGTTDDAVGGVAGFGGQVIKACGGPGSWTLESGGMCGGNSGVNANVFITDGPYHPNGDMGGSFSIYPDDDVLVSAGTLGADKGGVIFTSTSTGVHTNATGMGTKALYSLQDDPLLAVFGKANGLGDMELLSIFLTCGITVNSVTPSACNAIENKYSIDVSVTYENIPAGDILITTDNGASMAFTPTLTSGTETFTLTNIISDGIADIDVSATFVMDGTCTSTLIDAYDAPASCCTATYEICPGESYTLDAAAGLSNYQWWEANGAGVFVMIAGATNAAFVTSTIGIYKWTATDGSGCSAESCCPVAIIAGASCCSLNVPIVTVECNDNGTPGNTMDDTFVYMITVSGVGVAASTFTITGSDMQNTLAYDIANGPFGPFNISSGNLNLTITDDNDAGCQQTPVFVFAPLPCSSCPPPVCLPMSITVN